MPLPRSTRLVSSVALCALLGCDATTAPPEAIPPRAPLPPADLDSSRCATDDGDSCGGRSTGHCYCDDACVMHGDCCPDATSVCIGPREPTILIAEGLHAPESAVFDPETQAYFVSNLAYDILGTDPDQAPEQDLGYISKHAPDGRLLAARFASGLSSPKGLAIAGTVLYVADPTVILGFDTDTGQQVASHTAADVGLFNDIANAGDGTLYVTDTVNPGLYRLRPGGELEVVVRSTMFEFTNGVAAGEDAVYVATTGLLPSEAGPGTPGRVFAVDPQTGDVEPLGPTSGEWGGKWDGIVLLPSGWLVVNDFTSGEVHAIDPSTGETTKVSDSPVALLMPPAGIADMGIAGSNLLLPSMFTNQVFGFTPTFED